MGGLPSSIYLVENDHDCDSICKSVDLGLKDKLKAQMVALQLDAGGVANNGETNLIASVSSDGSVHLSLNFLQYTNSHVLI